MSELGRSSAVPAHGSRTLLVLWAFIAALGLGAGALLCSVSADAANSAMFGAPGTHVVLAAAFVSMVAGVVVKWRPGASDRVQQMVVSLLSVAAGATTVLAMGFIAGGEYAVVGILLIQSAIFIVVVAARVRGSSRDRTTPSAGAS